MICAKKEALIDEDGTIYCVHHSTGESLQKSASDGCHICSSVWNSLAAPQHKYLLESDTKDPITNALMSGPQVAGTSNLIEILTPDSLIVAVVFDLGEKLWNLPGAASERTNMFVLQPSEGIFLN